MADESQTIRGINWREAFPFTNIFKAFRVAVHPSKLVLALAALLLIWLGGLLLDAVWADKHLVQHDDPFHEVDRNDPRPYDAEGNPKPRGIFTTFFRTRSGSSTGSSTPPCIWTARTCTGA